MESLQEPRGMGSGRRPWGRAPCSEDGNCRLMTEGAGHNLKVLCGVGESRGLERHRLAMGSLIQFTIMRLAVVW